MLVTTQQRIDILNKYGKFNLLVDDHDGSFSARFLSPHNYNKFGWSFNTKDNAIKGLYDCLQGDLLCWCVPTGGDLDFDHDA